MSGRAAGLCWPANTLLFFFFFFFCLFISLSDAADPTCLPGHVSYIPTSREPVIITTPGFDYGSYPANMSCQVVFRGSSRESRIHVTVFSTEFEEPLFSTCTDYVSIRDGSTIMAKEIVRFCGTKNPRSISSTSDMLFIEFKSDQAIERKGVKLSVTEYSQPGCAPEWIQHNSLPFCYRLDTQHPMLTWLEAQEICNYEEGNLLTISSKDEYNFIMSTFKRNKTFPWVGYTDAQTEGTLQPIIPKETTWPPTYTVRGNTPEKNCIYFDLAVEEGMPHTADNCRVRRSYICKRNTDGSSVAVAGPRQLLRRGHVAQVMDMTIWILVIICSILFVILLCIFCYQPCRRMIKRRTNNRVDTSSSHQRLVGGIDQGSGRGVGRSSVRSATPPRISSVQIHAPVSHTTTNNSTTRKEDGRPLSGSGKRTTAERLPTLIERDSVMGSHSELGIELPTQPTPSIPPAPVQVPVQADVHQNSGDAVGVIDVPREDQRRPSADVDPGRLSVKPTILDVRTLGSEDYDEDGGVYIGPPGLRGDQKDGEPSGGEGGKEGKETGGVSQPSVPESTSHSGVVERPLPPLGATIRETTFQSGLEESSFVSRSKRGGELFERPKTKPLDNVSAISLDEFWRK